VYFPAMRIQRLEIANFRAITRLELSDLRDTIVIAGLSGIRCGSWLIALRETRNYFVITGKHVRWTVGNRSIKIADASPLTNLLVFWADGPK
jgi:hypothetical protein